VQYGRVTSPSAPVVVTGYPWPIESTRLSNGLRVVVSEDRSAPVVCVNLWYDVGSRHEPEGQTGFAHLFEHLMFEGSANVAKTEHMRLVQGNGGSLNATTNPDRTNYFETLPSEHLEMAFWLEADRMGGLVPALTQETLDNQREVVKNERRQRYENVPMADLNAAGLDTFKAFHQRYYAPNNCVLTVAGDAAPAEVFALAEKYFGAIDPVESIPPAPQNHLSGPASEPVRETVTGDVPAARVYLSHRTQQFGTAGYDAVTVLATVLGSLITEPVTEEELSRAKALLTTAWWRQVSTVGGRADLLGRYATQFGDPGSAAYRLPQWLAVTADDVTEVASLCLRPESRVTLTYLPEGKIA
jgi:zinc protease